MARLRVSFEVEVPDDMPTEKAEEWIAFEIGASCQMRATHPQMRCDLTPVAGSLDVTR
jgi:hypothetical protein